jgi:hypothetical protein
MPGLTATLLALPSLAAPAVPCAAVPSLALTASPRQPCLAGCSPCHACHASPCRASPRRPCLACLASPALAEPRLALPGLACLASPCRALPETAKPSLPRPAEPCPAAPGPAVPCRAKPACHAGPLPRPAGPAEPATPALPSPCLAERCLPCHACRALPGLPPRLTRACPAMPALMPCLCAPFQAQPCRCESSGCAPNLQLRLRHTSVERFADRVELREERVPFEQPTDLPAGVAETCARNSGSAIASRTPTYPSVTVFGVTLVTWTSAGSDGWSIRTTRRLLIAFRSWYTRCSSAARMSSHSHRSWIGESAGRATSSRSRALQTPCLRLSRSTSRARTFASILWPRPAVHSYVAITAFLLSSRPRRPRSGRTCRSCSSALTDASRRRRPCRRR